MDNNLLTLEEVLEHLKGGYQVAIPRDPLSGWLEKDGQAGQRVIPAEVLRQLDGKRITRAHTADGKLAYTFPRVPLYTLAPRRTFDHLTYAEAALILDQPRAKAKGEKRIGNNTILYYETAEEGGNLPTIAIQLHRTVILRLYPNGDTRYYTGGWKSVTTKDRLSNLGPRGFSISGSVGTRSHDAGEWWLYPPMTWPSWEASAAEQQAAHHQYQRSRVRFVEGIMVTAEGKIVSPEGETIETRVTFRRWAADGGSVVAILWDVDHRPGWVMMYGHIGQHGEGSPAIMSDGSTKPADLEDDKEARDLADELEGRGYILTEIKRTPKEY